MFTLPSWVQPLLLTMASGAVAWAVINAQSVTQQKTTISTLRTQTNEDKQRFLTEKQQMQAQLAQQQQTLNELTEKQMMLQSLVDALPSSLVEPLNDVENTPMPTPTDNVDVHLERLDEQHQTTEQLNSDNVSNQGEVSQGEQQNNFGAQAQRLVSNQQQLLSLISENIQNRAATLSSGLAEVGIAPKHNSALAQGGPYHQLELEELPQDYLNAIDNLVTLNNLEQVITTLPDSMPVAKDDYYISSQFGFRKDPITGRRAYHKGVDLAGWHKTEIIAPAAGTVIRAGRNGGYGKFIEIQHEHGLVSRFGHLHTIKVKKGQQIKKSEVIALMGSTGRSTSTHLHYEVLQNGKHINPIKLTKVINRVQ
ncbi:M23 family metallopeptidase [Pseudoalteromonas sp. S16_S37]|uniref:M23 family metallopeptidase n=1 Tax=Pseudoalteromonas sp. S16_S37 TaxID=2720228 RepID=UPI0016818C5A|nr:M23 family metallopeptidase [Pseudoalteromonas sp. S16_S37]MBD1581487.1 M23 family metallopeptidase [Pseudoalteromonas sp. S16_S37]